jgi:zinc transport system ATP-binding protein
MNEDYVIDIDNLCVTYKEGNVALTNITMQVLKGDYLGLIGPNGGGKSTLLKAMLNLIDHQKGSIKFFGGPLKDSLNRIGYVPQFSNFDREFPINVQEVVLTATTPKKFKLFSRYSTTQIEDANKALRLVGIEDLATRQIKSLSGGQFQRLLIARALALKPELLLLDEPTASVDSSSRQLIYDLLDKINQQGTTIVMISHDTMAISSKVKHIACISENLIYHGNPELNEEIVEELYGCNIDLLGHGIPHRVLPHHANEGF